MLFKHFPKQFYCFRDAANSSKHLIGIYIAKKPFSLQVIMATFYICQDKSIVQEEHIFHCSNKKAARI